MARLIALVGRSGAGKSSVSEYLRSRHGFHHVSTGFLCRSITRTLFGTDDKTMLNRVSDAMQSIDEDVWLKAAISGCNLAQDVVLDSIRFPNDEIIVRSKGFQIWRVEVPQAMRHDRLGKRGQAFDVEVDEAHASETSLDTLKADETLLNNGSIPQLHATVDRFLARSPVASSSQ